MTTGLKTCSPSEELTNEYLHGADEAYAAGVLLSEVHPAVAYEQAYDCIRKSMTAFLQHQGLRAGSENGHHAIVLEAVESQIGHVLGGLVKRLVTIKKHRHILQYPQSVFRVDVAMAKDALDTADKLHSGLKKIISSGQVPVFQ